MTAEIRFALPVVLIAAVMLLNGICMFAETPVRPTPLPEVAKKGKVSLEEALAKRRSIRRFKRDALSREQIAQLCWAAQGVTAPKRGFRTCPSAGATYPLELYVITAAGVERYMPAAHAMETHLAGDVRGRLQAAALGQGCVGSAPAVFVISAVLARTQRRYGERALRYVHMEVGHAGQNILLQAAAMGLGAVPVGAFHDDEVAKVLSLPADETILYLIPVGMPASND